MRASPLLGWGFAMDRVQWSLYGYSALVVGAACLAAAAALDSWRLAAAALAVMALGVIVLRLRDVEPAARDDRFAQIVSVAGCETQFGECTNRSLGAIATARGSVACVASVADRTAIWCRRRSEKRSRYNVYV